MEKQRVAFFASGKWVLQKTKRLPTGVRDMGSPEDEYLIMQSVVVKERDIIGGAYVRYFVQFIFSFVCLSNSFSLRLCSVVRAELA